MYEGFMWYSYRRDLNKKVNQYQYLNDHNIDLKPQATKKWHKIVMDIVTALIIIGGLVWFVVNMIM